MTRVSIGKVHRCGKSTVVIIDGPETRPNTIHAAPCKRCPSAHHPPDPEALAYQSAPRELQLSEGIFACAWRPNKLCKGVCDSLNVKEADL